MTRDLPVAGERVDQRFGDEIIGAEIHVQRKLATNSVKFGSPGSHAADSSTNRVETWHYRREVLPKAVPFQQVDFQFVTKQGYGDDVLQRDSNVVNTLTAAKP